MPRPRGRGSDARDWHVLVEHYTPDGMLGRFILGWTCAFASLLCFLWFLVAWTLSMPVAVLFGVAALAAGALAVVVLWPAYLSLIGNVDRPEDYVPGQPSPVARHEPVDEDPVVALKREYAAGNVTDAEFERRLERLLDAGTDGENRSPEERAPARGGTRAVERESGSE